MSHAEKEVHIDGAYGEGGGQILRTSLTLSLLTGRPLRMMSIRAGRKQPGLRRQHLTCVAAAAAVSGAEVQGNELGSQEVYFCPGPTRAGTYHFDIGSAGSATLVLQTVLLPLLFTTEPSRLDLVGGTHNPMAPPFEFLRGTYLPQLRAMGACVEIHCLRRGFYPAGGGRIVAEISPTRELEPLELIECGSLKRITATAMLSKLPEHIGQRELAKVQQKLRLPDDALRIVYIDDADGPGNALQLVVERERIMEVITGFGEKAVSAERVATNAARDVQSYLRSNAPVGEHLADQLLLPMAIGQGGRFRTGPLSEHTRTNMRTIAAFVDVDFSTIALEPHQWEVGVTPRHGGRVTQKVDHSTEQREHSKTIEIGENTSSWQTDRGPSK